MRTLILATMLFSASLAQGAENSELRKGCDGPGSGHHRPHCVKGDRAQTIFDNLDVEAKAISKENVTVTVKRNEGIVCRQVTSERGEFYACCFRRPHGDHKPDGPQGPEELSELEEGSGEAL